MGTRVHGVGDDGMTVKSSDAGKSSSLMPNSKVHNATRLIRALTKWYSLDVVVIA